MNGYANMGCAGSYAEAPRLPEAQAQLDALSVNLDRIENHLGELLGTIGSVLTPSPPEAPMPGALRAAEPARSSLSERLAGFNAQADRIAGKLASARTRVEV